MSLNANALISVDDFLMLTRATTTLYPSSYMTLYNAAAGASAATVEVSGTTMTLIVTGGASAGTTTINLAAGATDTLAELVAYINALGKGWVANRLGHSAQVSTGLYTIAQTGAFGAGNTVSLTGFDQLYVEQMINAASNWIERYCAREFMAATRTEYHDGDSRFRHLFVHAFPITSVTSIAAWDEGTQAIVGSLFTANTDYIVYLDEGMIEISGGLNDVHKGYRVIYVAGYTISSTVPADLMQATAQLVSIMLRTASSGGVSSERIGSYAVTYSGGSTAISEVPGETLATLNLYRDWRRFA